MSIIVNLARRFSKRARERRAKIFQQSFYLHTSTKILDLGSASGENINRVIRGTNILPGNVYIADINSQLVEKGAAEFGYIPVALKEMEDLPFADQFFDIVYCSSVIEHVTVSKKRVWCVKSGRRFRDEARQNQYSFSQIIKRLGRQYFVQTPNRFFPFESHTWLPLISFLPRRLLIPLLHLTNQFWVKETRPDWHLLSRKDMNTLFKGAKIVLEKSFGLTKSIMAISSDQLNEENPEAPNNLIS